MYDDVTQFRCLYLALRAAGLLVCLSGFLLTTRAVKGGGVTNGGLAQTPRLRLQVFFLATTTPKGVLLHTAVTPSSADHDTQKSLREQSSHADSDLSASNP
jgi:hypothetical protein